MKSPTTENNGERQNLETRSAQNRTRPDQEGDRLPPVQSQKVTKRVQFRFTYSVISLSQSLLYISCSEGGVTKVNDRPWAIRSFKLNTTVRH